MTNTAYPPKLQFAPDTAVTVAFPFGDFKLIDSKTEGWDPSFMYATTVAGTRHTLFAPAGLHAALQEFGIGAKSTVEITKITEQDDGQYVTRWQVLDPREALLPLAQPQAPQAAPQASIAPVAVATPAAAAASQSALLTFQAIAHHFRRCVQQAEKIYVEAGYTIDRAKPETLRAITAATSTLFIETNKKLDPAALMEERQPSEYVPEPVAAMNPPPADIHPDGLPF